MKTDHIGRRRSCHYGFTHMCYFSCIDLGEIMDLEDHIELLFEESICSL